MPANTRRATHAGSWYSEVSAELSESLEGWLAEVPKTVTGKDIPQPGARVIIAPHAGYAYSGETAAWSYKALDTSNIKRVFLLGPSHHFHLSKCALSNFKFYATPLGDIELDLDTITELKDTGEFDTMRSGTDENEHSLELHLPYIYKTMPNAKIVPILVGNTSPETEVKFGKLLGPYLLDPENVFVISSDFAHWGTRFSYTAYTPDKDNVDKIITLGRGVGPSRSPEIWESIAAIDEHSMNAIATGETSKFWAALRHSGNTVCGRHPIGVAMAAIEHLVQAGKIKDSRFQFINYERSSDCVKISDSSVSYVSAYAVIESQ